MLTRALLVFFGLTLLSSLSAILVSLMIGEDNIYIIAAVVGLLAAANGVGAICGYLWAKRRRNAEASRNKTA